MGFGPVIFLPRYFPYCARQRNLKAISFLKLIQINTMFFKATYKRIFVMAE